MCPSASTCAVYVVPRYVPMSFVPGLTTLAFTSLEICVGAPVDVFPVAVPFPTLVAAAGAGLCSGDGEMVSVCVCASVCASALGTGRPTDLVDQTWRHSSR